MFFQPHGKPVRTADIALRDFLVEPDGHGLFTTLIIFYHTPQNLSIYGRFFVKQSKKNA